MEVVASYKLAEINRAKLEALFHRIFMAAQLDLAIPDRFGHPVKPKEWFDVAELWAICKIYKKPMSFFAPDEP